MTITTNVPLDRPSALICWPVAFEYDLGADIYQPHCTVLFFPDVTKASKSDMLDALGHIAKVSYIHGYQIVEVDGGGAFGPDKNVPVLLLKRNGNLWNDTLTKAYRILNAAATGVSGAVADDTYEFNPHVTATLPLVINPPSRVILLPMELWWRNDEPVVI